MTLRTRYVMWLALRDLSIALEELVREWDDASVGIDDRQSVIHDFPPLVRRQSKAWWREMLRSADRLTESMRTGLQWNPRTPAEEALVYVVTCGGWQGVGRDSLEAEPALWEEFESLPRGSGEYPDFDWEEVLPALAGDADVGLLWEMEMDGLGDPEDEINRQLGMRDYRAVSWHRYVGWYVEEPEASSFLW